MPQEQEFAGGVFAGDAKKDRPDEQHGNEMSTNGKVTVARHRYRSTRTHLHADKRVGRNCFQKKFSEIRLQRLIHSNVLHKFVVRLCYEEFRQIGEEVAGQKATCEIRHINDAPVSQ